MPDEDGSATLRARLTHRRNALGADDLRTLSLANNVAHGHRAQARYEQARRLDEDTLARRRAILGADHPKTLSSANNLVVDLAALGDHDRARHLADDTLPRRRRVLGDDHPDMRPGIGYFSSSSGRQPKMLDISESPAR